MLKFDKPVFYNPTYGGFHVIHAFCHHQDKEDTVIVGNCTHFYNDAFTSTCRYEIPKSKLKEWMRLNKKKLKSYPFIEENNIGIAIKYINLFSINDDYRRCLWYKDECIINSFYKMH